MPETTNEPAPTGVSDTPWILARTAAVGLAMGAADIVPGVSGGTVALILGVYQRLLNALSRFDAELVRLVTSGRLRQAWRHLDATFLVALGLGVGAGAKGLASVMTYLLTEQQLYTYAAFFGMILASGVLVARMARPATALKAVQCVGMAILAAAFATWLMSQGRLTPQDNLLYTFFCGAIAICAMILPGISGAYLLLILGKYEEISGIIHEAPRFSLADATTLGVFALGCVVGLLLFSRFLKWLLARYWSSTMSVLAGFMIGSLYRVWPFQVDRTPEIEEFKLKAFEPVAPAALDYSVLACLLIAVGSFVAVLLVDAIGARFGEPTEEAGEAISEKPLG